MKKRSSHPKSPRADRTNKNVVLAIPDIHAPFGHPDHIAFLQAIKDKYKPAQIVCLGDEVDFHAISDYDTDPDGLSAGAELTAAIEALQPLYKMFPVVKVCTSNHTSRPFRKAVHVGLPSELIRPYRDFLKAPKGWDWAEYWEINGVVYEHGDPLTGAMAASKAAIANSQSTVIGHIHAFAGVLWVGSPKQLLFGLNAGCLIDKDAYAFAYGKKMKTKPIVGCGIVDGPVATFIPMILNSKGRWTGKL